MLRIWRRVGGCGVLVLPWGGGEVRAVASFPLWWPLAVRRRSPMRVPCSCVLWCYVVCRDGSRPSFADDAAIVCRAATFRLRDDRIVNGGLPVRGPPAGAVRKSVRALRATSILIARRCLAALAALAPVVALAGL